MKKLHMVTFILVIIGGLNWLVFGLFEVDIVGALFGGMTSMISKAVYIIVGVAAVYEIATHKANCKACASMGAKPASNQPTQPMA